MGRIRSVNGGFQIFDKSGKSLTKTIPELSIAKEVNVQLQLSDKLKRRKK